MAQVAGHEPAGTLFGEAVAVALAPSRAYASMLEAAPRISWTRMLRRPALVLLVIAITVSIAATGRVTISSIATAMLAWSFLLAIQMAAGVAIIATASARRVDMPTALDLLFAGHLPWSLSLLLVAAAAAAEVPRAAIAAMALVPVAWTMVVLNAFCVSALASSRRDAQLRVAAHQTMIWGFAVNYMAFNAGGWARFLT
jgi:hypothetical protein